MPSEAASVASRMRTGLCSGSVWNAALTRSRCLRVHPAVHGHQAVVAGEALGGEDALQPVLGGPVLGEEDDPLVAPLAAWPDVLVEPADQPLRLGVELGGGPFRPRLHLLQQRQLLGRRFPEQEAGGVEGLVGRLLGLVIDRVVLVHPVDLALEDAPGGPGDALPLPGVSERGLVLLQRAEEGGGAGEEPLLQGHQHEVGGEPLGVILGRPPPEFGVPLQGGVDARFSSAG